MIKENGVIPNVDEWNNPIQETLNGIGKGVTVIEEDE